MNALALLSLLPLLGATSDSGVQGVFSPDSSLGFNGVVDIGDGRRVSSFGADIPRFCEVGSGRGELKGVCFVLNQVCCGQEGW